MQGKRVTPDLTVCKWESRACSSDLMNPGPGNFLQHDFITCPPTVYHVYGTESCLCNRLYEWHCHQRAEWYWAKHFNSWVLVSSATAPDPGACWAAGLQSFSNPNVCKQVPEQTSETPETACYSHFCLSAFISNIKSRVSLFWWSE